MSNARPITTALKELREAASKLDGIERARLNCICSKAEKEWRDMRNKELRLNEYENIPEAANG